MVDFKSAIANLKQSLGQVDGLDGSVLQSLDKLQQDISGALQPFEGIDPSKARQALAQAEQLQGLNSQLQQITSERDTYQADLAAAKQNALELQKTLAGVRGMTQAGVRPEYEDLLLPKAVSSLQVEGDEIKAPENLWSDLKTRYPAAFYAEDGAGSGGAGGSESDLTAESVQVSNGIVQGVDPAKVLSGDVTLTMG